MTFQEASLEPTETKNGDAVSDIGDKSARRALAQRFFAVYGDWSDARIAEELAQNGPSVAARTIARARKGVNAPNADLAAAMGRKLDLALMTDEERFAHFEAERARREAIQRATRPFLTDEGKRADYPDWVDSAFKRYLAREFDVMVEVMDGRIGPDGAPDLPQSYLAFVLNLEATAYLETGRYLKAIALLDRALAEATDPMEHAHVRIVIRTNQAAAYLLLGRFDAALDQVEAILRDNGGHAPAYYNAICIAAARGDADLLNVWFGRTQTAAQNGFTYEALVEFIRRAQTDPDLQFARDQRGWADFERWMLALKGSMQQQLHDRNGSMDQMNDQSRSQRSPKMKLALTGLIAAAAVNLPTLAEAAAIWVEVVKGVAP